MKPQGFLAQRDERIRQLEIRGERYREALETLAHELQRWIINKNELDPLERCDFAVKIASAALSEDGK